MIESTSALTCATSSPRSTSRVTLGSRQRDQHLCQRVRTTELALTVSRDNGEEGRAGGANDMPQEQQCWLVGPVHVVEHEEHRSRLRCGREQGGDGFEQAVPLSLSFRVARRRGRKIGNAATQLRDERSELGPTAGRSQLCTQLSVRAVADIPGERLNEGLVRDQILLIVV